jgi:hypothetical protein
MHKSTQMLSAFPSAVSSLLRWQRSRVPVTCGVSGDEWENSLGGNGTTSLLSGKIHKPLTLNRGTADIN